MRHQEAEFGILRLPTEMTRVKQDKPFTEGLTLREIVARLGGNLIGPGSVRIHGICSLLHSRSGFITFLNDLRYRRLAEASQASAIILSESAELRTTIPQIRCTDPYAYFAELAGLLYPPNRPQAGRHPSSFIDSSAKISSSASIEPNAVLGPGVSVGPRAVVGPGCFLGAGVKVGAESVLHANVAVYSGCQIGSRVIVHSGSVLGADGFGFANKGGRWSKIPQVGRVIVGDDVEIGANTTIDRGTLDDTVIGNGVKLDNLVQIGHNVQIGDDTAMAGCVGIAGSATIGRRCTIGGGAIVLGHIELADDVHVSAATLITKSISKAGTYSGAYPFAENREWAKSAVAVRTFPAILQRLRRLEQPSREAVRDTVASRRKNPTSSK